ncbi:MAG: nitrogen fixation NifU-like protein [Lysobacterales bacterium]|jgi:nitrogen fixation NifU-like protein
MLNKLYQETIVKQSLNTKYLTAPTNITHSASGYNQLCGDSIKIDLNIQDNTISNIGLHLESCAICKASANLMADAVKNKDPQDVITLILDIESLCQNKPGLISCEIQESISILKELHKSPSRIKCATLPWQTLKSAIEKQQRTTSTE